MKSLQKVLLFFLIVCSLFVYGQNKYPGKIESYTKVMESHSWYIEQTNLWKREVERNPINANAWFNLYRASRYTIITADKDQRRQERLPDLEGIVEDMGKYIPETFEYAYVRFINSSDRNQQIKYLLKAFEISPDNIELWLDMILYFEIRRDEIKKAEYCIKYFDSNDLSPSLYAWNYNMLIGLDKNAIIVTSGDNDTYPSWILQHSKDIRKDVTVINAGTLYYEDYRSLIMNELVIPRFEGNVSDYPDFVKFLNDFTKHIAGNINERSLYFAKTLPVKYYAKFSNNCFNEGLAVKYSKEPYDNLDRIDENYKQYFLLDYMNITLMNDVSQNIVNKMNTDYIDGFEQLYKKYRSEGNQFHMEKLKNLMLKISNNSNSERIMKQTSLKEEIIN